MIFDFLTALFLLVAIVIISIIVRKNKVKEISLKRKHVVVNIKLNVNNLF